jgi:uncharacterized protein YggL (DUF469 family)
MKVSQLQNLGHHVRYSFVVSLTTLSAAQNVRRLINVSEKYIGEDLEGHGCIPVSSTICSFANKTQQNLKKPWESGHND